MKIARSTLKQLIRAPSHQIQESTWMPDVADAIAQGNETMDLVEIINEIGALVAQNHYRLTFKYDMGSMDLAGDLITEFEDALVPYMNDCFGEDADTNIKLGKTVEWLDEAIREELEG